MLILLFALLLPRYDVTIMPVPGWSLDSKTGTADCHYAYGYVWRRHGSRGNWHIFDIRGGVCRPIPEGLR